MSPGSHGPAIEHLLRELAPQVLGAVARRHGDFAAAEDAVQEALIAAATQWPETVIPDNPRGWLFRVAMRRYDDQLRSELARRCREDAVAFAAMEDRIELAGDLESGFQKDDTLLLLFMCCHPSLSAASAVALTLRAVGGLTTGQIARAFLVPEATMAQRISRAKQSIRESGGTFGMPSPSERAQRLGSVLHVLYLIFNEGYASTSGRDLQRPDLAREAIRLGRALREQLPRDPEVTGLLALMLLTHARREARTGPVGELIPLDEQDRSLWDRGMIEEGEALVSEALARGSVGPYQIQAAIAALHDEAPSTEDTDWPQILWLYTLLEQMTPNPMISLNRAVAVAMVQGPEAGLEGLSALEEDPRIAGHYRLAAVRGHLLERAGQVREAIAHFARAAEGTASRAERDYLRTKITRLERKDPEVGLRRFDSAPSTPREGGSDGRALPD